MNVLRIALKEMKIAREPQMLVFMLATPVLLILILGTALSNALTAVPRLETFGCYTITTEQNPRLRSNGRFSCRRRSVHRAWSLSKSRKAWTEGRK